MVMSGGFVVSFLLLEVVARIVLPAPLPWLYPQVRYRADPTLTFGLLPEQRAYSADKFVEINERGLRGPVRPYEKSPGRNRILFLGDSITFGYGVDDQDIVSTRVAELLEKNGIKADVINSGVPAYNTRQEVDYLENEGVRYRPDWVVVGFYWNDLGHKSGVRVSSDGWLVSEGEDLQVIESRAKLWTSKYGSFMRNSIKRVRFMYGATRGFRALSARGNAGPNGQLRADLLQGRGSALVENGWKQVGHSLHRLRELATRHGFCPLVVAYPIPLALEKSFPKSGYPRTARELSEEEGIPFVDLEPAFRTAYEGHESLFIPYDGDHPNAQGHALAAEAIAKFLTENVDGCSQPS